MQKRYDVQKEKNTFPFSGSIRNRYLFLLDIFLCVFSYCFAILFIFPVTSFFQVLASGAGMIILSTVIYCAILAIMRVYYVDWIYAGVQEYLTLFGACILAAIGSSILGEFVGAEDLYLKFNIMANCIVIASICGLRALLRLAKKMVTSYSGSKGKRVLIIGAGRLGVMLLREIQDNINLKYNVVGLIDDNPEKRRARIYGAKVLGDRYDIVHLCRELDVQEIIFAIYTIDAQARRELFDICAATDCKLKILPGVEGSLHTAGKATKIRDVSIEDLLERDPIQLNNDQIASDIKGKVVLVTGGGGSIGSELCRQILKYQPERLIIVDIYENTTYELQNELEEKYPEQKIDVLIASVRDKERLNLIFEKYRPEVVFHAAAHKHVPLMEYSPGEAIKNNVFGTYNTALCAEEYGVRRFVMISTDKAVNPTNVMGASKRMCEMIVQTMQKLGKTEFVAVRFGNVLGSNGSVIPRFKKQIASGGPVTVTHKEITRFFMMIPEAAQLVLQAAAYAKGGEIFVLDMGEPVKIYDLAKKMISLSGFKPNVDIEIKITGLRPGEKLYEELLMNEEGLQKTAHSKIFVGQPIDIDMLTLTQKLDKLREVQAGDEEEIKRIISEVVPTYRYQPKQQAESSAV